MPEIIVLIIVTLGIFAVIELADYYGEQDYSG